MFPAYYIVKNRNTIYRATEINRIFFIKEALMRSFLGVFLGFGISLAYYGGDKDARATIEYDADG